MVFDEFLKHYAAIPVGLYAINFIFIFAVIFFERKSSSAALAWIMVLAFLPVVGFVFYLFLNQNLSRMQINRLYDNEYDAFEKILKEQIDDLDGGTALPENPAAVANRDLLKLNQVYGGSVYTDGNDVELIIDGSILFKRMLDDIAAAKKSVYVEYFIIKNDEIGKQLIRALTQKASQGVKVKLLVDTQGSRMIGNRATREFRKAGGQVGFFFPPRLYKFGLKIGLNLNYRNHRKIVVIDDEIGYTGGYNIGREYCNLVPRFGYWRDSHVRIRGEAVKELQGRFILDWRFTTKEKLVIPTEVDRTNKPGKIGMQIVSCGPEAPTQEVKRAYMKMITSAKKYVYIQSPYFVPDQSIIESCKMAAQSGVDVRVMIPCKPDHIFVYWATYSFVGELIRSGCRVFIYDKGFLHAKTVVCDDEVASVGSTNFDIRSFKLNFETNAFFYDEGFAKTMKDTFIEDITYGHELTEEEFEQRSLWIKFKESLSRLLTDIL